VFSFFLETEVPTLVLLTSLLEIRPTSSLCRNCNVTNTQFYSTDIPVQAHIIHKVQQQFYLGPKLK